MAIALKCKVYIDGLDISDKVSRIEIEKDICRIAATCRLELDPSAYSSIEPWNELEIWEMGDKRFTGYVDEVTKERMPHACVVSGTDVLKRAVCHFIDEEIVSQGESLEYWVNQMLAVAGLGPAAIGGSTGKIVPTDYLFQYRFAGDYLQMLAAYAGWAIYADGWGTVHFKDAQYSAPRHTVSGPALTKSELERSRDRMWIRNRALVFGVGDVKADISRPNRYLPGETIAGVVASPEWDTVEKAILTANEMLDEYNDPLDNKFAVIPGDPSYELSDTVNINDMFTSLGVGRPYRAMVTSIVSQMSEEGYTMRVGFDAKCPRIWGWGRYLPSMGREWLSLNGGGVYRYDYVSEAWVAINEGLEGDALYVREVEPNPLEDDIAWIVTLDGIYEYLYSLWVKETIPNPVNDAGDDPAPISTELDFVSIEVVSTDYMLATARHKSLDRGWLYVYSEEAWSSYQMVIGASYDVKPLAGPQALYVPEEGKAYITADAGATRKLLRWNGESFAVPYSTTGLPFEVAGPWSMPDTIYLFGDPTPVLLKSATGGDTQTDISPGSDPVRPVLALPWREDDLFVVSSLGSGLHRDVDEWIAKGDVPITPGCGMRSQYGGVQILLGQKEAGDVHKVAFSGTLGEDWGDMSEGLPDIAVTSISGLEGAEGLPPKPKIDTIETCTELVQAWIGYHWSSWYPTFWSYHHFPLEGWPPEWQRFRASYFRRAMRGIRITSWTAYNCQIIGDATYFALEICFYSPWPVYLGSDPIARPSLWYKTAGTLEQLTGAPIPMTEVSVKYVQSPHYSDLGDGDYRVRYTVGLNVTDSEPYMAYSLRVMLESPRPSIIGTIIGGEFNCSTDNYVAWVSGWLGETSYDSLNFWTLKGEFNYHYGRVYQGHKLDLGDHLGTCERASTGHQYSLWNAIGGYEGLDIDNHHLLDLGLGIIRKVV